jgi:hypothetical protein
MGQRRANQRAAHAEAGGKFVLRQFGARRQRLLDDRPAQSLTGEIDTGGLLAHPNSRRGARR